MRELPEKPRPGPWGGPQRLPVRELRQARMALAQRLLVQEYPRRPGPLPRVLPQLRVLPQALARGARPVPLRERPVPGCPVELRQVFRRILDCMSPLKVFRVDEEG